MSAPSKVAARGIAATVVALCLTPMASASTLSLSITDTVRDIVGSTAVVTGSGSEANTRPWADGESARFEMTEDVTNTNFYLDVAPTATTGDFGPGASLDNLMIVRTVDSQGLTDTGTLSIYMRPTASLDLTTNDYSVTMRLSLYSDVTFTTPAPLSLTVTSLDIDFDQQMIVDSNSITSYALSNSTDIITTNAGSDITFTGPGSASFDDPEAAVSLNYINTSTFDITFAHDRVALYMLEFRSPSTVLNEDFTTISTIPLPASAMMLIAALGGLGALHARRKAA